MAEPSLRETLENSYKDAGEAPSSPPMDQQPEGRADDSGDSPGTSPVDTGTGVPDSPVVRPDDERSYLTQEGAKKDGAPAPEQPTQPQSQQPAQPASDIKAPTSWRPELREAFKGLAEPIQREILRREADVQRFVQETAGIRKYVEDFENVCAPYRQLIALEGGDPLKTFNDYLRTASLLRIGTPVEKAQAIASAVRQFNVDVNALDSALAALYGGQPPQQGNGANGAQPQYQDPRVDQLLQAMEQSHQQKEREMEERQLGEIDRFRNDPKNEYFEDLRKDIADLLDFNANRGVRMTIQQAYDMAVQMNPAIAKLHAEKKIREQAAANQALLAQKRKAAIGLPGVPDVGTQTKQSDTIRGALEAAFNQHSQPV